MTGPVKAVVSLGLQEMHTFAERLQREPAGEAALLSLTASGDPAARDRGFLVGLRAALDNTVEPPPPNLHNSWGDWPHSLFAELQPHVATIEGIGIGVFAWPSGRREVIATGVPLQATSYYLTRPVTFPLILAAQSLLPVVAVELHRSYAEVSQFSGQRARLVTRVQRPEEGRVPKTGTRGMEHAERHESEVEGRHLAGVAGEVRSVADAQAIVVSGVESLRRPFVRELGARLPVAEIDWNPDRQGSAVASQIAEAAAAALKSRRMSEAAAAVATGLAITDWATVVAEADEGRLHEIWMDPSLALHVYRCGSCSNVVEGSRACARCGADPWSRLPLPELVVRSAARTKAELHFADLVGVTGLTRTGVVALCRY